MDAKVRRRRHSGGQQALLR